MFNEEVFIIALTERPEDARRFSQIFEPQWLEASEYSPVLQTVYDFTKETGEPPSLPTIHKILDKRDPDAYKLRYKKALEKIEAYSPDRSEMLFTLGEANNVAITRSFMALCQDDRFLLSQEANEGTQIVERVQHWLTQLGDTTGDKTMDIKQAVDSLIKNAEFDPVNVRIPTNINVLDGWTGGGLRKKQLAVLIAPTGHGKTSLLLVIGYKMATIERANVWFITNELVMDEVAERVLSRLTGVEVDKIMNDPTVAYKGLDHQWKQNLEKRLVVTEYTRETSTDDLEAEINRMKNLKGWKPDVIVLDYMERMKPSLAGYRRDNEWGWLGAIAKDLVRLSKKYNVLIWTAAQTNRAGLNADNLDMTMAQSSIRHLQEATAVVAMHQREIPNSDDIVLRLHSLKQRQSKRAVRPVNLRCDLSRMSIKNEEVEEDELKGKEETDGDDNLLTPKERQKRGY